MKARREHGCTSHLYDRHAGCEICRINRWTRREFGMLTTTGQRLELGWRIHAVERISTGTVGLAPLCGVSFWDLSMICSGIISQMLTQWLTLIEYIFLIPALIDAWFLSVAQEIVACVKTQPQLIVLTESFIRRALPVLVSTCLTRWTQCLKIQRTYRRVSNSVVVRGSMAGPNCYHCQPLRSQTACVFLRCMKYRLYRFMRNDTF